MNIHPILVHFPIALLTIYALMELVRFKFVLRQPYWFYVKAVTVILGSGASVLAYLTGDSAEELIQSDKQLLAVAQVHEFYATLTVIVFGFIALCYLIAWYAKYKQEKGIILEAAVVKFVNWIVLGWPVVVLALFGLITVTITGGLGGAMVFGPHADPLFEPVYHMLTGQ